MPHSATDTENDLAAVESQTIAPASVAIMRSSRSLIVQAEAVDPPNPRTTRRDVWWADQGWRPHRVSRLPAECAEHRFEVAKLSQKSAQKGCPMAIFAPKLPENSLFGGGYSRQNFN
jgi:hypothetical protein